MEAIAARLQLLPIPYGGASNRIATHTGNTVTLDDAGNTLADPTEDLSFTYGDHNRMVEASVDAQLKASYVYNGQGQRVKKIEATGAERTIIYHYGLSGELLGETIYSEAGAKIGERDYVWIDSLPIAQSEREFSGSTITSDTLVYLHADQLDTPRLATDASGTVVWRWDSDAFGIGEADQDPDSDMDEVNVRLRFPGQYSDEETRLHYNYFRDYDPVTGRYIQSDPIGLQGGINTYGYALANPMRYFDPDGLEVRFICRDVRDTPGGSQHCFVFVSCPSEGWSRVFSLFRSEAGAGRGMGYKYGYSPDLDLVGRDDPFAPDNTFDAEAQPPQCYFDACGYEREVARRFGAFATGYVPYGAVYGPNSNTFASYLIGRSARPPNAPPDTIFGGAPAIDADPEGFFE